MGGLVPSNLGYVAEGQIIAIIYFQNKAYVIDQYNNHIQKEMILITYQICGRCSKMFEKNKELYCESCSKLNKKDYDLITRHIRDNPGATVMEVITATGASLKSINCFLEDGSISYVGDITGGRGKKISIAEKVEVKTGRFHTRRSRR